MNDNRVNEKLDALLAKADSSIATQAPTKPAVQRLFGEAMKTFSATAEVLPATFGAPLDPTQGGAIPRRVSIGPVGAELGAGYLPNIRLGDQSFGAGRGLTELINLMPEGRERAFKDFLAPDPDAVGAMQQFVSPRAGTERLGLGDLRTRLAEAQEARPFSEQLVAGIIDPIGFVATGGGVGKAGLAGARAARLGARAIPSAARAAPGAARAVPSAIREIPTMARRPFTQTTSPMTRRSMPTGEYRTPSGEIVSRPQGVPGVSMTDPIFESPVQEIRRRGPQMIREAPGQLADVGRATASQLAEAGRVSASQLADVGKAIKASPTTVPRAAAAFGRETVEAIDNQFQRFDEASERILPTPSQRAKREGAVEYRELPGNEDYIPNLINMQEIGEGTLSPMQKLKSVILGQDYDDRALGMMQERDRVGRQVSSLGTGIAAKLQSSLNKAFKPGKDGRIKFLKNPETGEAIESAGIDKTLNENSASPFFGQSQVSGAPTIQDIAARYRTYEAYLTPDQIRALQDARFQLQPWEDVISSGDVPVDLGRRHDIQEGGFYIPRGRTSQKTGIMDRLKEVPIRMKEGRGLDSFEKTARYDSMAQGVDIGDKYGPIGTAIKEYVTDVGDKFRDALIKEYATTLKDPATGKLVASTSKMRVDPVLRKQIKKLRSQLAGKRRTLLGQEVRWAAKAQEAARIGRQYEDVARSADQAERDFMQLSEAFVQEDLNAVRNELRYVGARSKNLGIEIGRLTEQIKMGGKELSAVDLKLIKARDDFAQAYDEASRKLQLAEDVPILDDAGNVTGEFIEKSLRSGELSRGVRNPEMLLKRRIVGGHLAEYNNLHFDILDLEKQAEELAQRLYGADEVIGLYGKRGTLEFEESMLRNSSAEQARMLREFEHDANVIAAAKREKTVRGVYANVLDRLTGQARTRATNAFNRMEGSTQEITAKENRLKSLLPQWDEAVAASRQTPEGYKPIQADYLTGYTFPEVFANTANEILAQEGRTTGAMAGVLRAANAINNMYRSLNATADNSALAIQGILGLANDQRAYARALEVNYKSWGNDDALGHFLRNQDRIMEQEGRLSTDDLARFGLHIGGAETEFAFGRGVSQLPGVRQANRAFGNFGDALRVAWTDDLLREAIDPPWHQRVFGKQSRTLDDIVDSGDIYKITEVINRMTGHSPTRAFGDMGDLLLFAPRFLQSRLETVAKAAMSVRPGATLDQRMARKSLLKTIGWAVLFTEAINRVQGTQTDYRMYTKGGDGKWRYNSNFLRIRFNERDYSLLGTWDSLVRAMMTSVWDPSKGRPAPEQAARGMGSGLLKSSWDLLSGEEFTGERVRDDPGKLLKWTAETVSPFAFQELPSAAKDIGRGAAEGDIGTIGGGLFTIAGEAVGAKSAPLSFTDVADNVSREKGYGPYSEAEPFMRNEVKEDERAIAVSERRPQSRYFEELDRIDTEFDAQMQFLVTNKGKVIDGQVIDDNFIRRRYGEIVGNRIRNRDAAARSFGVEWDQDDINDSDLNKRALAQYHQLSERAGIGEEGVGGFNPILFNQLRTEFLNGLSAAAREYVYRNINIRTIPPQILNSLSPSQRRLNQLSNQARKRRLQRVRAVARAS